MSGEFEPVSLREAAAAISLGLHDLAKAVDELQPLMGELVLRAGLSADEATLQKAQTMDWVSQHLHRYAAVMSQLGACAPEDIRLMLHRWATPTASTHVGECEFF